MSYSGFKGYEICDLDFMSLAVGARGRARGPGAEAWLAYVAATVDYRFRALCTGFTASIPGGHLYIKN